MDTTQLCEAIRQRAEELRAGEGPAVDRELHLALARLLEQSEDNLSVRTVHRAFGAPGDWGYGTPVGEGLRDIYGALIE